MVHSTRLESVRRKARGFESHLLRLRLAEVPILSGRKRASPVQLGFDEIKSAISSP